MWLLERGRRHAGSGHSLHSYGVHTYGVHTLVSYSSVSPVHRRENNLLPSQSTRRSVLQLFRAALGVSKKASSCVSTTARPQNSTLTTSLAESDRLPVTPADDSQADWGSRQSDRRLLPSRNGGHSVGRSPMMSRNVGTRSTWVLGVWDLTPAGMPGPRTMRGRLVSSM